MLHSTHAQDLQASALRVCQVRRHQGLPVPLSGLGWQLLFTGALCPGQFTIAGCFLYGPYFLQCMSSVHRLGCSWPERQLLIAWHWDNVRRHGLASSQSLAASQMPPKQLLGPDLQDTFTC